MRGKREHWGACMVRVITGALSSGGPYPTMEGAIDALDPFQRAIHWPLGNVQGYLGRMGVAS
jgi:hypothetical protein